MRLLELPAAARVAYLSKNDVEPFFAVLPADRTRDRLLFDVIYRYGLRLTEAIRISREHLSEGGIWIPRLKGSRSEEDPIHPATRKLLWNGFAHKVDVGRTGASWLTGDASGVGQHAIPPSASTLGAKPSGTTRGYDAAVSIAGKLRYVRKQIFGGDETMLKVGDPAPDFDVRDQRGNPVKLSDFRGKRVVLWFYPKADTPG